MSPTGQPTPPLRVAIIAAAPARAARPLRFAQWIHGIASKRDSAAYEVVDLADLLAGTVSRRPGP